MCLYAQTCAPLPARSSSCFTCNSLDCRALSMLRLQGRPYQHALSVLHISGNLLLIEDFWDREGNRISWAAALWQLKVFKCQEQSANIRLFSPCMASLQLSVFKKLHILKSSPVRKANVSHTTILIL